MKKNQRLIPEKNIASKYVSEDLQTVYFLHILLKYWNVTISFKKVPRSLVFLFEHKAMFKVDGKVNLPNILSFFGALLKVDCNNHCVKRLRIRSNSGPHFATFGLNMERYSVSLRIQSECGKMRTKITPNTDTFYEVNTGNVRAKFSRSC